MRKVAEVIDTIRRVGSYNDKLALLKVHENVPGLKEILKFIYNPYCKTGISAAKARRLEGRSECSGLSCDYTWADAISYFSMHTTGSDTDIAWAASFVNHTYAQDGALAAELAIALITQDLKIGITATSLNKVYGADFIPKTGCMLGTLYSDVGPFKTQWPCIVTEKLDGVRRILVKEKGVCRFYSRSGHEDTGLVDILAEAKYLPDNYMYDGELLAAGTFKDSIAQRQATNSLAACKGTKTGLVFNIFDMVPVAEFYRGSSKAVARERKILLGATLGDESIQYIDEDWMRRIIAFNIERDLKWIKTVPILGVVSNIHDVEPIVGPIWARGGEGVMLNTMNGYYEIKRSKQLLKVKHTEDHVLTVVDMTEGTNKYEDSLGALVVEYKGSYVGVGSGFTDAQRHEIWSNPAKYIGRKIEVETFGESTNAQGYVSLNCPIFKRFVGDE